MEMLKYEFMDYGLLAGLLGGIACSAIGVLVISMQSAFIGVAISQAAFAGSIIALFWGFNPLIGAFIFSLVSAAAIGPIADRGEFSPDTPLGVIFAMMQGLAFLFMGMMSNSKTQSLNLMWGNTLIVNELGLKIIIITFILVVGSIVMFYKEILAVIFNREIALSIGLPASWIFYGLLFLTGITVAANLQSIGGLLVCTLIITPAAAAYQLTYSLKHLFIIAAVFGVFSCWAGLILTYYINLPSGSIIAIISSMIFFVVNVLSPRKKVKSIKSLQFWSE